MAEITLNISNLDSNLTRAENIVKVLGFTGATGNHVLSVLKLLDAYQRLEEEASAKSDILPAQPERK